MIALEAGSQGREDSGAGASGGEKCQEGSRQQCQTWPDGSREVPSGLGEP